MGYNSKYTGEQVDEALDKANTALQEHQDIRGKQDVITDLDSIRSGAAKGATALQSYTETDPVFSKSAAAGITSSDITNWNGKTSNAGTVTGVKINGTTKSPTNGVVDLGTVITSHQDISGKLDASVAASTYATKGELSAVQDIANKANAASQEAERVSNNAESTAKAIVIPADGPSFGTAPSGK